MRIVEYINKNGRITISEMTLMFKITRQASLKEIDRMIELEIVKREGKARASYYVTK
jgi:predicted HTH transcriptional regulator